VAVDVLGDACLKENGPLPVRAGTDARAGVSLCVGLGQETVTGYGAGLSSDGRLTGIEHHVSRKPHPRRFLTPQRSFRAFCMLPQGHDTHRTRPYQ